MSRLAYGVDWTFKDETLPGVTVGGNDRRPGCFPRAFGRVGLVRFGGHLLEQVEVSHGDGRQGEEEATDQAARLTNWKEMPVPQEWIGLGDRGALCALLGEVGGGDEVLFGRLRRASGILLYNDSGGPGISVFAPKPILRDPGPIDICRWLLPQLEFWGGKEYLPAVYELADWGIDKIEDGIGNEF